MTPKLLSSAAALALLAACEARIGNDAPPVDENASAAGRAEAGRLTVEAPGFNMSIQIPERIRADVDGDGLIYPGSNFGGIHIQGKGERSGRSRDGEVELSFTSGDAPDRVVAWYRDPARGDDLTIESSRREGDIFLISGTGRRDRDRFSVRIAPRAGGGTEARLVLSGDD